MKKILIIGIGAGDPEYITIQAVNALNRVDVFFMLDKGASKADLNALRKDICRRYIKGDDYRFVDADSPCWPRDTETYLPTVEALNADKKVLYERLIAEEMAEGECGAFLVWGDPSLYDSTIRIVELIAQTSGLELEYDVIPGITSVQALAARHRVPIGRIGQGVEITTGRKMLEGFPNTVDSVVVMLDASDAYSRFVDQDIDIYWGAYLGTPDEILVSGKLKDVSDDIKTIRAKARSEKGWIMDTYLLHKNGKK
jgi:precorrin-6A synthase